MIDETKIMQYADGTLPLEEKESVKRAIESDPQLQKLLKDYQETGEILFNLGKEIKSQPLPKSLQDKLNTIKEWNEKSGETKKPFMFFKIPKIAYAGIAAAFAFILYNAFQTTAPLMVDVINDGAALRASATFKKFEIIEPVPASDEAMLNIEDTKDFYDNYLKLYNFEKKIDEKNSKKQFTNKIKKITKAAFGGEDAKTVYSKWKNSVVWITNPTADIKDDEIMLGGGIGTGSFVNNSGLIITNWHVIKNANQVWVYPFPKDPAKGLKMDKVVNAEKFLAKIVAISKKNDLALLQTTGISKKIKPIPLGINDKVVPGERVFAIGHPAFYGWSITDGIINQVRVNDKWNYGLPPKEGEEFDHEATILQTSAEIEGGSSGGPLFNEKGNMIGINNMGEIGSNNINFAIVVKHAQDLINNKDQTGIKTTTTVEPLTEKKLRQQHPKAQADDYSKNGKIDTWYVDVNGNGVGDTIYADDDEDGFIESIYIDKDEDGSPEIRIIDQDLDGRPDEKWIDRDDQNDDVKWDTIAVDIDQDGTWDKVQDIPKS